MKRAWIAILPLASAPVAAQPAPAPAPAPAPDTAEVVAIAPSPKPEDHTSLRLVGIGVGVGGVVLGGLGGYLAWRASEDAHTVSNFRGEWTQQQRDVDQSGQAAATWSTITIVAGAASIATGTVLYYLGSRTPDSHLGVAVSPSGARVGWSVAF